MNKSRIFAFLVVFALGGMAMANLTMLIDTNSLYNAQWWKVASFSALAAITALVNA